MLVILMVLAKIATPVLLKIKVFVKKLMTHKISVHDVANNILLHDLNYNVNLVM